MDTHNLKIRLLDVYQAQKEITINEALVKIDAFYNKGITGYEFDKPPVAPNYGDLYIIGPNPEGEWVDKPGFLACYLDYWHMIPPRQGMIYWANDKQDLYVYKENSWRSITGKT